MLIRFLTLASILATTGCATVAAHPTRMGRCNTDAAREVSLSMSAAQQSFELKDFSAAGRHYLTAAAAHDEFVDACTTTTPTSACTLWLAAAEAGLVAMDDGIIGYAVRGYRACNQVHPHLVPSAHDRVIIQVASTRAGQPSSHALPAGAEELQDVLERARDRARREALAKNPTHEEK